MKAYFIKEHFSNSLCDEPLSFGCPNFKVHFTFGGLLIFHSVYSHCLFVFITGNGFVFHCLAHKGDGLEY